ncbi:MAG: hypothetical protein M1839_007363 [Geoglossum umbratile]|nr:MAG: hypothetical protein M1839_007363 [Geoglossum umbratile]
MYSKNEIEARLAVLDGVGEQLLPLNPLAPTPHRTNRYVTVIEDSTTAGGGGMDRFLRRFSLRELVLRLLSLFWCAPALWVLVVNFQQHAVGPSLACAKCYPNPVFSNYSGELARLAVADHNVVGVLQLVAKILEIWFVALAASFIHDIISLRAKREGGIAFGLLTAYLEFKDMPYIFSPHLWGSASVQTRRRAGSITGYLLVILVVALALEAALIGPAMAVLLIPTVRFRMVRYVKGPIARIAAADPPRNFSLTLDCSSQLLSIGNYSCTESPYSSSLDAILSSAVFSNITQPGAFLAPGISQEGSVFFQLNATLGDPKEVKKYLWSPNRYVLRQVSAEFREEASGSLNRSFGLPALDIDNSQQTFYHRVGPTLSGVGLCVSANFSVNVLAPGKEIRCYGVGRAYGIDSFLNTCVKYGSGWGPGYDQSQFFLGWEDYWDNTWVASVNATIFQSDQITYIPWGGRTCPMTQAYNGQWLYDETCPWNSLFNSSNPIPATFVEYHVPGVTYPNQTVMCWSETSLGFRDYVLDSLGVQPDRLDLVTVNDLPDVDEKPVRMHPDWLLAGWSVDRNGTVRSRRASARAVVTGIKLTIDDPSTGNLRYLTLMQQLVFSQAASMIDYNTTLGNGTFDKSNPSLDTFRMIKVYSYGFFSVPTKLAAAVVTAGLLFCLLHALLFVIERPRGLHSYQDLLAMAFKHQPGPEVADQNALRRTTVRIATDTGGVSNFIIGGKGKGVSRRGDSGALEHQDGP